jgi:hypothetical protein
VAFIIADRVVTKRQKNSFQSAVFSQLIKYNPQIPSPKIVAVAAAVEVS